MKFVTQKYSITSRNLKNKIGRVPFSDTRPFVQDVVLSSDADFHHGAALADFLVVHEGPRPGNVKARGKRRSRAAPGRAGKMREALKGRDCCGGDAKDVALAGLMVFVGPETPGLARASRCLGCNIAWPAALHASYAPRFCVALVPGDEEADSMGASETGCGGRFVIISLKKSCLR